MENINFESNIFSKGMHLTGSINMIANLGATDKRLCNTCGNELGKNKCRLLGKIKYPDNEYCSWWRRKNYIKTKKCSSCGRAKSINNFYKNRANPDGHQGKCIKCALIYGKEYQGNDNGNKIKNL